MMSRALWKLWNQAVGCIFRSCGKWENVNNFEKAIREKSDAKQIYSKTIRAHWSELRAETGSSQSHLSWPKDFCIVTTNLYLIIGFHWYSNFLATISRPCPTRVFISPCDSHNIFLIPSIGDRRQQFRGYVAFILSVDHKGPLKQNHSHKFDNLVLSIDHCVFSYLVPSVIGKL